MSNWFILLVTDKKVYNLMKLSILFLMLLIIVSFFYSGFFNNAISIISSVLASLITAIIIVYFSYFKNLMLRMKPLFKELYEEIEENNHKLINFEDNCKDLKDNWIMGNSFPEDFNPNGHYWLVKEMPLYEDRRFAISEFAWRYLKLTAFPKISIKDYPNEIFSLGGNSDKISIMENYYQECHKFCDKIQESESKGNIFSDYIGILKNRGKEEDIIPKRILFKNMYIPSNPEYIALDECKIQIESTVEEMIKTRDDFLSDKFPQYLGLLTEDKEDFLDSFFIQTNSNESLINFSMPITISLLLATIITSFVYILKELVDRVPYIIYNPNLYMLDIYFFIIWIILLTFGLISWKFLSIKSYFN